MDVLVDSSVWIDYFRGGAKAIKLDYLIDENLLVTNDLILAELLPFLKLKKQPGIISLLQKIRRLPLQIDWAEIIEFQVLCLKAGVNGIGIPDLIITQNAKDFGCWIYSHDKHFEFMAKVLRIKLY